MHSLQRVLRTSFLLTLGLLIFPQIAFAHPGYGSHVHSFAGGFLHPISGFDHILAMVAVGFWVVQLGGRAVWKLPFVFVLLMLVGGLLNSSGVSLPGVESFIVSSGLIFGLLLTFRTSLSFSMGASLVGFFALFHGYAHVNELGDHQAFSYILGFAAMTLLLHVVGISVGLLSTQKYPRSLQWFGVATVFASLGLILS